MAGEIPLRVSVPSWGQRADEKLWQLVLVTVAHSQDVWKVPWPADHAEVLRMPGWEPEGSGVPARRLKMAEAGRRVGQTGHSVPTGWPR